MADKDDCRVIDDPVNSNGYNQNLLINNHAGLSLSVDDDDNHEQKCSCNCNSPCVLKYTKRKLPILNWLPQYRAMTFYSDLIAGLTVGLTVLPQGLAYGSLAGLPRQYGLYSAMLGGFMYCIFGTSRDISIGPTAIISIVSATFCFGSPAYAALLTLFSGLILIVMGVLHLGFVMNYVSFPVINGFTSAASIIVATSQLKNMLGLKDIPRDFVHCIIETCKKIKDTNVYDLALSVVCIIVLEVLRQLKNRKCAPRDTPLPMAQNILRKFIWIIGTARNAIVVTISAGLAYGFVQHNIQVFTLTGHMEPGLPDFKFPDFSTVDEKNQTVTFNQMMSRIGTGLLVIPLISFLESIAIAKAFSRVGGYTIDATQEMLALGISNVFSSFVGSYPITGSFSRSAVNNQSGVMTPASGIVCSIIVIIALEFLTPAFNYIPDAALGAVITAAVIHLFDYSTFRVLWKVRKLDLFCLIVTFLSSLLWSIEYGVLVGAAVSVAILLYPEARPTVKVRTLDPGVVVVTIGRGLSFPGIEYIQGKVNKCFVGDCPRHVIVDCHLLTNFDYTTLQGFKQLISDHQSLHFAGLTPWMVKMMQTSLEDFKCSPSIEDALQACFVDDVILSKGQKLKKTDANTATHDETVA